VKTAGLRKDRKIKARQSLAGAVARIRTKSPVSLSVRGKFASAALYGEITLRKGRVEQANFDTYQILRMDEAPAIEVHLVESSEPRMEWARPARRDRSRHRYGRAEGVSANNNSQLGEVT
jgi:hypothetical protein